MLSSIAGLNEGVITTNEKIKDAVTFKKITPSPSCHNKSGHGSVNVETAIRDSCNYYFYEVGWRLGGGNFGNFNEKLALSKLENYANMFGLNRTTGIELPEREPQFSYDDAVRSAIGQGKTRYTPVQLARYVSTIANGGTVYDLTLISKIEDKDGKTIFKKEPKKSGEVKDISNVYWNAVHEGMYRVVNDTSLKDMFQALNVKVAGKTGTAQINEYHPNTALFVSYAPYEKPEIAVTVVIPNGYTSANSADVASKVYDYYFGSTNLDEIVESGANQEENHTNFTD